ncbi:MAG: right-handed parallel beta-helix repeat-containing protein [Candidatus Hydrogenedentes bacterium]|nr:right-handed parallel beta-helix repeat-containing protein [Candidatus Hydrogenedentota bacterium]
MRWGLAVLMIMSMAGLSGAADLHVAAGGVDTNPGTEEAPFATMARARDAIRAMKQAQGVPPGGVTVWVHEGAYEFAESLGLAEEDSGTPDAPVAYRAAPGESVRLVGGRTLPADAFVPLAAPAAVDRVDEGARAAVRYADLEALGITEYGVFPEAFGGAASVAELFFNDARMTLARWPNEDWATIARVVESGVPEGARWKADKPGTFEYSGDRPARWVNAPDVWLHGYWCFDWRAETIKVGAIDLAQGRITLLKPHGYGIGGGNPAPRRYHAVNLLEELDSPGEYYLDREAGLLYFWPPEPLDGARILLSTLSAPILVLDGASHVTIQGFTIEGCVGTGLRVNGGRQNRIAACLVRNTGTDGIVVEGGERHTVTACDIHDTGTAGLRMAGGDRPTLTPCGHEAVNNHIWSVSRRQRTGAYHIHLAGVGIRVAHNLLHDGPHQSIGLTGNEHVIEFNEVHHTGMETDDCGSFYMGRNPSERGSIIRYNFWHDIGSTFTHGSAAIYFDDGSGGQTVYGNVFYRAAGGHFGAVFVHGGHDNVVDNSIFIECRLAIRHAPWPDKAWHEHLAEEDWQNKLLKEVDITKPPYSERYPDLEGFLTPSDEPRLNRASRNLIVNCDAFVEGNWILLDNWVLDHDPGFVDPAALNFQLRDDAEVFSRLPGFQPIPFSEIGLVRDELRPELPAR